MRLAQTLQCERSAPGGCGTCLSCRKIERGIHPDVQLLTRATDKKDIAIEQIRDIQTNLALRPLEGRHRVVVIDDAGALNQFGQDALLKTLEEPPSHAVLLLVTPTPAALHETIRSRLQPLHLRLVPTAEIAQGLSARGVAEAERLAAAAAGRPGVAIDLAAGDAVRTDRARIEAELYRLFGSGLSDRFAWAAEMNEIPDDAERGRKRTGEITRRFDHWSELLRDAAVASRGDLARPLRPERAVETEALASGVAPAELLDTALLVQRLRRDLEWNANARAMLELFVLRLPFSKAMAARLEPESRGAGR